MKRKVKEKVDSEPVNALTPVLMVGATWLATKFAEQIYLRVTGANPPSVKDPEEKIIRIAIWTAVLTAAVTISEVVVERIFGADRD